MSKAIAAFLSVWALTGLMFSLPVTATATPCGDSLRILLHVHGADSLSQIGWSIGALGDVNHDGFADVAISQYHAPLTYVLLGGNPASQLPAESLFGIFQGAIDLDGDGGDEIVTSWVFEQSTAPRGAIYFYREFSDSVASRPYDSIYSATYNAGYGTSVVVGDADGDSLGDMLISQPNLIGGPSLHLLRDWSATHDTTSSWSFDATQYSYLFTSFGFCDVNCDGRNDIFVGLVTHVDTTGHVYVFYGPNFRAAPDLILSSPAGLAGHTVRNYAQFVADVGDLNGDGFSDLGVVYDFQLLVYLSKPTAMIDPDLILQGRAHTCGRAGDVNGDGHGDLVAGQTRTEDGAVDIYLGGTQLDSSYDCSVYRADLPPVFLNDIGFQVASAGDFNGDGVDDFMFSCRNFAYGTPGDVFVVAGGRDILTPVQGDSQRQLPLSFLLHSPFPNPFNPSTTISFDLPKRESVTLTVYDVMGREVRVLMHQTLGAGTHSVEWDGLNSRGQPAASGVYLFTLKTPKYQKTVKGTLLK